LNFRLLSVAGFLQAIALLYKVRPQSVTVLQLAIQGGTGVLG